MRNRKNFIAFAFRRVVLILLIIPIFLTACGGNEPLMSGFTIAGLYDPTGGFCAYSSEAREFDINNVELTFYFGGLFPDQIMPEDKNIPYFDIYFSNAFENEIFIKRINEQFVSEKYRCVINGISSPSTISYNYSEKIKIPSELFNNMEGVVTFSIRAPREYVYSDIYYCSSSISLYYKRHNDTIVLSERK